MEVEKSGNDGHVEREAVTALMMTRLILFVPVYSHQLSFTHNHSF